MYINKHTKNYVVEVYLQSYDQRLKDFLSDLKAAGFTHTTESFLSTFWGTRINIDRPVGKGCTKRCYELTDLVRKHKFN